MLPFDGWDPLIPDSQYSNFNANNRTVFTVTVATPSTEGVYTCEVENSVGTSAVNFTLIVIGELGTLIRLHVLKV
jgi:hypothetical protein